MKRVYIYGLTEPDPPHEFRYVGWTTNPERRLRNHCTSKERRLVVNSWIGELLSRGLMPRMVVLQTVNWAMRFAAETAEIARLAPYHKLLNEMLDTRGPSPKCLAAWKAKLAAGYAPHARAVCCVATGKSWPTVAKAARHLGLTPTAVIMRIRHKTPIKGHLLCYGDRMTSPAEFAPRTGNKKRVFCLNTGVGYESVASAAKSVGKAPSTMAGAIKSKTKCNGSYWAFADVCPSLEEYLRDKTSKALRLMRADTGEQFNSLRAAARSIGVKHMSLRKAIIKQRPCKGVIFKPI